MNGMHPAAPDLHTVLTTWLWLPGWTGFTALLLAAYVAGLVTSRRRVVHPVRVGCFVAGTVLLLATLSSAIGGYAMDALWVHMVEHLMLIMVVPALLVLGHPLTVLRAAAAAHGHEDRVDRLLHSGPVSFLTHPLVAMLQYSVVIVATHLTSFMDVMADHDRLVSAEQALYLASGYVFLLPLIGHEPIRWRLPELGRIGLVLLAMTPDTIVGIVLLQTGDDLFPAMSRLHPAWAPSPVADVNIAGGLMWAVGDGLMMVIGVGLTVALISHPSSGNLLGRRLEGVRRSTLLAQVSRSDDDDARVNEHADVDDDEAMLAAYNRMLRRLQDPSGESRT